MTVKQIILQYLEANGYDGLCNPDQECGCFKHDICPCEQFMDVDACRPGHKRMGDDGDWGIFDDDIQQTNGKG